MPVLYSGALMSRHSCLVYLMNAGMLISIVRLLALRVFIGKTYFFKTAIVFSCANPRSNSSLTECHVAPSSG